MKVCLAIQSLRSCGLEEAAGIARALGFDAMDLDGVMGTTLTREGILSVARSEVDRVKALGLTVPNIHWTFSQGSFLPAINDPDPAARANHREQIQRLVEFCHAAGILSILVLPGVFLPGQRAADAYKLSAEALNDYCEVARPANVALMFESHVGSAFESPAGTARLAQQVSGVGIVLDYAHFIAQGYTMPDVDPLLEHTTHVHLRQAKPGLLQTRLEDGTINFPLVLDKLRGVGYDGYLCVEYVHQAYLGADNVDVITETVKMRNLLRQRLMPD